MASIIVLAIKHPSWIYDRILEISSEILQTNVGQEVCRSPKVSTDYKLRLLEAELEALLNNIPADTKVSRVSRIIPFLDVV